MLRNDDVIREEFEMWAEKHKFIIKRDEKTTDEKGHLIYSNPMTQGAWMAFDYAMGLAAACLRAELDLSESESIH